LIQRITGLENLEKLQKLELGMNKISRIENLDNKKDLLNISLEDNQISTLENFPNLPNLMELYLGNNQIQNIKEIKNIKGLCKLIILCISGNTLTKDLNYRTYVIFNFNKLKVLDGIPIEQHEQQISKEMFVGRLTEEVLSKRLNGHKISTV